MPMASSPSPLRSEPHAEVLSGAPSSPFHLYSRAPDDLYKNGIQREQFLPCIELIKDSFVVKCLDSDIGQSTFTHLLTSLALADSSRVYCRLSKTTTSAEQGLLQPYRRSQPRRDSEAIRLARWQRGDCRASPSRSLGSSDQCPSVHAHYCHVQVHRAVRETSQRSGLPRDHQDVRHHLPR